MVYTGIPFPDADGANWPTRPVKLVVPYAAGGGTDVIARIISIHLTKVLGQPIVIDNRPGAATMVGSEAVARAAPDGYTVLVTTGTLNRERASNSRTCRTVAADRR